MKNIGEFILTVFRLPILVGVLVALIGAAFIIVAASLVNGVNEEVEEI